MSIPSINKKQFLKILDGSELSDKVWLELNEAFDEAASYLLVETFIDEPVIIEAYDGTNLSITVESNKQRQIITDAFAAFKWRDGIGVLATLIEKCPRVVFTRGYGETLGNQRLLIFPEIAVSRSFIFVLLQEISYETKNI